MGRWKKSKSFIIRNNNLLKNYRQSDRCYKLITIIWREKKIARNVATGNGSNSRSHFKISKFSVISQRAFFFIQMIKLNGWRLRKFLSGNRWRSLARFFLLAHFFILALIFFLFFSEKWGVQRGCGRPASQNVGVGGWQVLHDHLWQGWLPKLEVCKLLNWSSRQAKVIICVRLAM